MVNNDCKCTTCKCGEQQRQDFYNTFENDIPYITIPSNGPNVVRKFPADTPAYLLKWHEDEEDRIMYVSEMTDWKFQFDNELPIELHPSKQIHIPQGRVHRLIKGSGDLTIEIRML